MVARLFGAEFEYNNNVGRSLLYVLMKPAVLAESEHPIYNRGESTESWNIKHEHCGCEMTTPCLDFTKANLKMVCKVLDHLKKSLGDISNNAIATNCGLHLHVTTAMPRGSTSKQWARFFKVWQAMESPLTSVLPNHRRNNGNVSLLQNLYRHTSSYRDGYEFPENKYYGVHLVHGSHIEVRYAPSTLDSEYFFQWTCLVRAMIEIAEYYAIARKFNPLLLFGDMPEDHRDRLDAQALVEFLIAHDRCIQTPWIKHNMVPMIRWISKQHKEHYNKTVMLAA